jgi:hypothetical protein
MLTFWLLLALATPYILMLLGLWHHNDLLKRLLAMVFFYAAAFVLINFLLALRNMFYR